MKIESVRANNRKKAFEIETRTGAYTFPYALLRLQPDPKNRITEAFPDEDLGKEGFTYRLAKGGEGHRPPRRRTRVQSRSGLSERPPASPLDVGSAEGRGVHRLE